MANSVQQKSRLQFWLIVGVTATVLFGAFLVFPKNEAQTRWLLNLLGTSNKGLLLMPGTPLSELSLTDQQGKSWRLGDQRRAWRLLLPVADGCGESCRERLLLTRQVHVRLDKHAHRLDRLLLNLGDPLAADTLAQLRAEHPHLIVLNGDRNAFANLLAGTNAPWDGETVKVYVVDQGGVAMLAYLPAHGGKDMLADLNHLMKYSPEQ